MDWNSLKEEFDRFLNREKGIDDGDDGDDGSEVITYEETPEYADSYETERRVQRSKRISHIENREDKVVKMATTAILQVVLAQPDRYEDASGIADNLNAKRTVVLNLEKTPKDVARRLVDFLSGVAYANDGQIKKVANNTFIITPYDVDVSGDLLDELENTGVFF